MTSEHDKLFRLIHKGDAPGLAKYLRTQVDLNDVTDRGWTPLMWACDQECFELVRLLVENGADVNKRDQNGWGPLHMAQHLY